MRIISGTLRGKKIHLPEDKKTRPLRDLVKESIFNLINHSSKFDFDIINTNILDCFSGSGSFGLECLSRGALEVTFVENYSLAIEILKKNINNLKLNRQSNYYQKKILDYLNDENHINNNFDLIFLDPPYKELNTNHIIEKVEKLNILKENGLIVMHRHRKNNLDISQKLKILDTRTYGISKIIIGSLSSN
tara:strand:+ start:35 stop:607 length:573 start_codon:yes stop_codon:yes gene_type:complete